MYKGVIQNNVQKVIALSTDKCISPVNLYGATKLCLEKLIIAGNHLSGHKVKFSVLRYGNVFGSRGSVVPLFLKQKEEGMIAVTDSRMTRFTMLLQEAINFVLNCSLDMIGGEIFIPMLPSYNICQLANIIAPGIKIREVGIRPGEKLHESMIGESESYLAIINNNRYIIHSASEKYNNNKFTEKYGNLYCQTGYVYSSGDNKIISDKRMLEMINLYNTEKQ
jgi:UDP-N-acetylglucosamine 4,6-dehydratase